MGAAGGCWAAAAKARARAATQAGRHKLRNNERMHNLKLGMDTTMPHPAWVVHGRFAGRQKRRTKLANRSKMGRPVVGEPMRHFKCAVGVISGLFFLGGIVFAGAQTPAANTPTVLTVVDEDGV